MSRAYYNHRYSDDLDFFVNSDDNYQQYVALTLSRLKENGYNWGGNEGIVSSNTFTTLKVRKGTNDTSLKLDFVNDYAVRFDDVVETKLYYRTDSVRNIISNKLSAVFRFSPKDVADIREIAIRGKIDWNQSITEARQKEGGIELTYIADIMRGIPKTEFEKIIWTKPQEWEEFQKDIECIVYDMISCTSQLEKPHTISSTKAEYLKIINEAAADCKSNGDKPKRNLNRD